MRDSPHGFKGSAVDFDRPDLDDFREKPHRPLRTLAPVILREFKIHYEKVFHI
jgi:hypothetical protein